MVLPHYSPGDTALLQGVHLAESAKPAPDEMEAKLHTASGQIRALQHQLQVQAQEQELEQVSDSSCA